MAIITNINLIKNFCTNSLVLDYLHNASLKGSVIRERIFNLPLNSFVKNDLNDEIFAIEQCYITKDKEHCFWESHKKFIDIQLHLCGIEQMEFISTSKMEILEDYNMNKDLIIYKNNNNSNKLIMQKNDIAIFFPEDAHMGIGKYKSPSKIYKTCVKLPIGLWK